jgi:hypothetical protein
MRAIVYRYKHRFSEKQFQLSSVLSGLLLIGSLLVNFTAITFATYHESNSVTDIVLSNTQIFDVDGLFVYGTLIFVVFTVIILFVHPRRIPFALYSMALFFLIRSVFTSLTHIAPFEAYYASSFGPTITHAFFGGDTFFSGHTGMPFLGALAFWREKSVRYTFLVGSLFFGVIVLLGHLHYSIDVLSAFFITYGIYHIALYLFPREWEWFVSDH